jgi:NAD(P)-dependent dehydrogenase (short-subunit alcohol dehydrogenase family)
MEQIYLVKNTRYNMKNKLLIFGAYGALGKGATKVLVEKEYDEIYLFGSHIDEETKVLRPNVNNITVNDLSIEKNVFNAFSKIKPAKEKTFYLFSTIGGFNGGKFIWETEESDIEKMFNINFKTNFLLAKHFAKLVKDSAGGSICFTSAYTGLHADAKKGAYGISKSALNSLVKTLALEGKEINLSANAVAPYIIDTPDNRQWMKSGDYSEWIKPEEIGELVHSLFNNYNFTTGNIIELKDRF